MVRVRMIALLLAAVTLGTGLGAREWLSGASAKYSGVALWATLVYALIVAVTPRARVGGVAVVALAVSFAVELAQLTDGPAWLSAQHILLRLVFGTTFNAWDLPAYAAGVAFGAALHRLLRCFPA